MNQIPRVKEAIASRVDSASVREILGVIAAIAFTVIAGIVQASLS